MDTPIKKTPNSKLRQAADRLLFLQTQKGLDDFVAEERALGSSWSNISRRIFVLTNEVIEIEPSTLYRWYEEQPKEKASA
jgi:hypothetical protein